MPRAFHEHSAVLLPALVIIGRRDAWSNCGSVARAALRGPGCVRSGALPHASNSRKYIASPAFRFGQCPTPGVFYCLLMFERVLVSPHPSRSVRSSVERPAGGRKKSEREELSSRSYPLR
jgi:hypothetical protein